MGLPSTVDCGSGLHENSALTLFLLLSTQLSTDLSSHGYGFNNIAGCRPLVTNGLWMRFNKFTISTYSPIVRINEGRHKVGFQLCRVRVILHHSPCNLFCDNFISSFGITTMKSYDLSACAPASIVHIKEIETMWSCTFILLFSVVPMFAPQKWQCLMKQGRIETQSPLHPPILLRPKGPIFFCETVRSVWDREHSTVNLGWQVVVGDWTYHILDSWHQFNINIRAIIIKYIIICVCGFEYDVFEGQGTNSNPFRLEAIFQTKRSLPPHFV